MLRVFNIFHLYAIYQPPINARNTLAMKIKNSIVVGSIIGNILL